MREKPIVMTVEEIISPIKQAISEIETIKEDINSLQKKYQIKSNFTYVFALFECSLNETLEYMLCSIPEKLEFKKLDLKDLKRSIVNSTDKESIIEHIAEKSIINLSYKSLEDYLEIFNNILGTEKIDNNLIENLKEKKARRNLLLHNNLKINSKYLKSSGINNQSKKIGDKLIINKKYLNDTIQVVIKVLNKKLENLKNKYQSYTRKKLLIDLWYYLFDSPMLNFDSYWIINKDKSISFNSEARKYISNLSSYETTMLMIWTQQFSQNLAKEIFNPIKTSMWIGMEDEVSFFASIVKKYPHIFQNV